MSIAIWSEVEEAYLWVGLREMGGRNDDANDSDRSMTKTSARRTAMQVERGSMVLRHQAQIRESNGSGAEAEGLQAEGYSSKSKNFQVYAKRELYQKRGKRGKREKKKKKEERKREREREQVDLPILVDIIIYNSSMLL